MALCPGSGPGQSGTFAGGAALSGADTCGQGALDGPAAVVWWTCGSPSNRVRQVRLIEQVGMGSCSDQVQVVAFDLVEEQPVRLNVKIAKVVPIPGERVVLIARWQHVRFA